MSYVTRSLSAQRSFYSVANITAYFYNTKFFGIVLFGADYQARSQWGVLGQGWGAGSMRISSRRVLVRRRMVNISESMTTLSPLAGMAPVE